ncbi:hypothetical protein IEQ34_014702 [Dendrobium chrysotoxum]|uniref:Vacuolar iron transporter n=1 Tax=Dendrobium chrysotoxum TaxID=161865 RepID=A0AAV7G3W8_DENCH|nr:hypothetical protein IEQ34_014702 [Dendrobium chrysotoxum]
MKPQIPTIVQISIPSTLKDPSSAATTPKPAAPTNYSARAQWVRAAVLGANDGLVSIASLMIGVSALNAKAHFMLASGLAGLFAGAFSMAIGEFVSVCSQYDIEVAELKRMNHGDVDAAKKEGGMPSPSRAAAASFVSFALGAMLPLLAGGFIGSWVARLAVVWMVSSVGLAGFGAAGAYFGGSSVMKATVRVLAGGWLAMCITFGMLRFAAFAFQLDTSGGI